MSTITDEAVQSSFADVAARLGLTLDLAGTAETVGAMNGPFVTAQVTDESGELQVLVAVVDEMTEASEERLSALCEAVAEMGPAPSPKGPVGGGPELLAEFAVPPSVVAFATGDQPQAVVLMAQERRASASEGAADGGTGPAVQAAQMANAAVAVAAAGFNKLANVTLDVSVELGRTQAPLAEVLAYDIGSVVELDRAAGAPVDIRVNGTLLAQGEVVLIDDEYAVRITAVFDPQMRA